MEARVAYSYDYHILQLDTLVGEVTDNLEFVNLLSKFGTLLN